MTKLVVQELFTGSTLSQTVNLNNNGVYQLEGVKAWIYMHNEPSGTFTLSIKKDGSTLASKSFDSAEIKSELETTDRYAHLWKILDLDRTPLTDGEYEFELSSSGYTFSSSSWLGWVKPHENEYIENSLNESESNNSAYGLRLFEEKLAR